MPLDQTQLTERKCSADFVSEVGNKTPVFVRFSTVGGEKGSADAARDPRSLDLILPKYMWENMGMMI